MIPRSRTPHLLSLTLPTIGNIIFVSLLFVLAFNSAKGLLADGDTGYHIRTGEIILRQWQVPTEDPYSFHSPPLKWTAHEWLSEVVMAGIFRAFGLTGVVLFFAFLIAVTHWLLYRSLRARSNAFLLCVVVTVLATATSSLHWLARPHVFSLLFIVVWYHYLDRFQYWNDSRFIWYAPLIMLVWINLHGGFIFGLLITLIYFGCNCLYALRGSPMERQQHAFKARKLCAITLVVLAACLVNPNGVDILWFPFRIVSDSFIMEWVTEFQPPNFHKALPFKTMLLALIVTLGVSRSKLNLIESSLVLLLSYMAFHSARHVSLFAIIISPILLRTAQSSVTRLPPRLFELYLRRDRHFIMTDSKLNGGLWPALGVILMSGLALAGKANFRFDSEKFPVEAAEFIKNETISGNMFNNDEFGDYLIFQAWPKYRVFIDGRSDMYGRKYGNSYLKLANAQLGWQDELDRYDISWIIFDTYSPLTAALKEQQGWQPIYSDQTATIFVKKTPAHAGLIARYPAVSVPPAVP